LEALLVRGGAAPVLIGMGNGITLFVMAEECLLVLDIHIVNIKYGIMPQ
jgi:hypothetical protein